MQIKIYVISYLTNLPQTNYSKFHNIWSFMMIIQFHLKS